MYQSIVEVILRHYGLNVVDIGAPQKGYRNESYRLTLASGELLNLIFHKNEERAPERIRSANVAADALSIDSLPVRTQYDNRVLKISDGKKEVYAGVYIYLPGETIPWEAYTKNHIKLLGWAMSDMHAAWRDSSASIPPRIDEELRLVSQRMMRYFASPDVLRAMKEKVDLAVEVDFTRYERLFKKFHKTSLNDEHTLHMDLVRGNVLFANTKQSDRWRIDNVSLSGVIDFEKAAIGHPVYDIARTLAFLLVDCANKDRSSIYKYFLESGYNKRGKSSFLRTDRIGGLPAHRVLNILVGFFLLHDFYKFLKHTPYESLIYNHHFVRTRDILIDYGMIRLMKD